MRIKSSFTDYYDSHQQYVLGKSWYWMREVGTPIDFPLTFGLFKTSYGPWSNKIHSTPVVVGVAGRVHYGLYLYQINRDVFPTYYQRVKTVWSKEDWLETTGRELIHDKNMDRKVTSYFRTIEDNSVFLKGNCPVFCSWIGDTPSNQQEVYPHTISIGETQRSSVKPTLGGLDFPMPVAEVYELCSSYITGFLMAEHKTVPVAPNDVRVQSAGFDLKKSFRGKHTACREEI